MWYKNLLRTDNGLEPQIVRVTEEIDKGIKHRRDITNPSHGMPLFRLGRLVAYFYPILPYALCKYNEVTMGTIPAAKQFQSLSNHQCQVF
jgi:hypothetical protein